MTNIIAEGRALAERATARPWKYDAKLYIWSHVGHMVAEMRGVGSKLPMDENAAYIVHCANHFPALADRIEALEAENARLNAENLVREYRIEDAIQTLERGKGGSWASTHHNLLKSKMAISGDLANKDLTAMYGPAKEAEKFLYDRRKTPPGGPDDRP